MKKIIGALSITAMIIMGSVTAADAQGYYQQTQTNRAWSQRATGAVVGAGSGAIIGAVLNRNNPAGGAAIGTLAGAAIGYMIGDREDRINPRPQYVQRTTMYDQYGRVVGAEKRYTNNPRGRGNAYGRYKKNYNNNYNTGYNNNGYNNGNCNNNNYNTGYNNGGYYR